MRGLGRNIKFMMGFFLKFQVRCYLIIAIMSVVFGRLRHGIKPFINESVPFFVFVISLTLILLCALNHSDMYYNTMVSQGSARKPAALGMLLSQYVFMGIQLAIILGMAVLTDNDWSLAIKNCPLGLIAVMFILQGVGIICATLVKSGHNAWALILCFGLIVTGVVSGVLLGAQYDFVWSAEMVKPYNNLLFLAAGVLLDLMGSVAYYKIMQKVDLKLA